MMGHPVQVILTRQLAAYLSVPALLFDLEGNVIFYNEPAEALVGTRFDETGVLPLEEWWTAFARFDVEGKPIERKDHHVMIALREKRPTSRRIRFRGMDGVVRPIDVTSIPLTGLQGEVLGAISLFWELSE
jgi:PAS domain-containing protein